MQLAWGRAGGQAAAGRRVAVTGLGVVVRCGIGKDAFWEGLCAPAPVGDRRITGFDPTAWFGPKEVRRVDRFAQLSVASAAMALEDAGAVDPDPDRAGVVMGTGVGGIETLEDQFVVSQQKGPDRVSPFLVPMMMANAGSAMVSMRYGWRGPCETVATACAAGAHAIGNGARLVASGRCEVVLAGGAEAAMIPVTLSGFGNMTALSASGVSRPFDLERDGFVLAEGSAAMVLEDLDRARVRGAPVLAELAGAASTADAHHITAPAPGGTGAAACMEEALDDAAMTPRQIAHINAHGTSTTLNDAAEAEAINKVFGTPGPVLTSIKGVTGHALGAAGAIEAVASVLTIDRRMIPPTAGYATPDPELHLDVVAGAPRPWEPGPVLSNSFGFGGHNGCLIFVPPSDD
ncbi:MAG: beta-ketoacyl-ACP synthase II [Actinobacteria bacterium]|nr:MAG: beta-ketoacyl-ACP synthase II [Actinomycetota bacterium]